MKRIILAVCVFAGMQNANAQVVVDTVITGNKYTENVWYSLENDEQGSSAGTNWQIALATTVAQSSELSAAIRFNHKMGKLYTIPGALPANFATIDTAGMVANGELYNSDEKWGEGAFSDVTLTGQFDYGWGQYNMTSHNLEANRIFVIKYNDNTYHKLMISLNTVGKKYIITFSNLNSGTATTTELDYANITNRNFVYFSLQDNLMVNREPASSTWDLTFMQYLATLSPTMKYITFGILTNVGVEAVKVLAVANPASFVDYVSQTFSDNMNVIGYNWKDAQAQTVPSDVVYFIKDKSNSIWKVIFTEFKTGSGTSINTNVFSKEKLVNSLGVDALNAEMFVNVYPNPASSTVSVVVDNQAAAEMKIMNALGQVIYQENLLATGLQVLNVNVSDFQAGIYHVVVASDKQVSSQKLIVQ
jgi:hypothetical protein